jgi:magnesium-transporting ATPase (P-type)
MCECGGFGNFIPVKLAAGDMIPVDIRILSCKDLFLTETSLTGESFPVEKFDIPATAGKTPYCNSPSSTVTFRPD